jgi:hypothetical protein
VSEVKAQVRFDDEARDVIKDEFARDMAAAQERAGAIPTPTENADLVAQAMNRLENKVAEATPAAADVVDPRPEETEAQRKARELGWELTRDSAPAADDADLVEPPAAQTTLYERMNARVELLLTKQDPGLLGAPSWAQRVEDVVRFKYEHMPRPIGLIRDPLTGKPIKAVYDKAELGRHRRRYTAMLVQVLEESSAVCGDWKKPPAAAPITVDLGAG